MSATIAVANIDDRPFRTPLDFLRGQCLWMIGLCTTLAFEGGHLDSFNRWTLLHWAALVLPAALLTMLPTMLLLGARLPNPRSVHWGRLLLGVVCLFGLVPRALSTRFGGDQSYLGLYFNALTWGFFAFAGNWLTLLVDGLAFVIKGGWRHLRSAVTGTNASGTLTVPPCSHARIFLAFVFTSKAMAKVYDPTIADTQAEWFEAEAAGERRRAQWIRIRGYLILARVVAAHGFADVVGTVVEIFKMMKS